MYSSSGSDSYEAAWDRNTLFLTPSNSHPFWGVKVGQDPEINVGFYWIQIAEAQRKSLKPSCTSDPADHGS